MVCCNRSMEDVEHRADNAMSSLAPDVQLSEAAVSQCVKQHAKNCNILFLEDESVGLTLQLFTFCFVSPGRCVKD